MKEILAELKNKLKDKQWRLNNLYYIVDKNSKKIKFKENTVQKRLSSNNSKKKIILKARQMGITTHQVIEMFDYVCWNRNVTAVILCHENDALKKIFNIVKRAYDFMHPSIRPKIDRGGGSVNQLYFPEINSRIFTDLEVRGTTINWLHISEAAFAKWERIDATLQAVPIDGTITFETTPNGIGNNFYEFYFDKTNDFYSRFFFPWFFHDEYQMPTKKINYTDEEKDLMEMALKKFKVKMTKEQIAWQRMKKAELKEMFYQEYPSDEHTCFLTSGDPAINLLVVEEMIKKAKAPITEKGNFKIYKYHQKKHYYVIGADTAEGVGGDYSVAHVYDVTNMELVATLRGHIKPYDFAHQLNELGKMYQRGNDPFPIIAVERNNHGHAVLLELKENLVYRNLFHDKDERVGWKTDKISRPIMLNGFIEAIESRRISIPDIDTLKECLTLVNNNGKIEAVEGKHDDCVIASSIALQMVIASSSIAMYNEIKSKILL